MTELPESILEFWFGHDLETPEVVASLTGRWFGADPSFDQEIRERFGDLPSRAAAGELNADRSIAALSELVVALASPQGGTPDPDALALAGEIISPAIASHMVVLLGEMRDEEERDRMISLCSGLGREMALALADALAG